MKNQNNTLKEEQEILLVHLGLGMQYAYEDIFRKFYEPLCFFADKIIDDSDKSEDLVQDVLITLWEKRKDFNTLASLRSFLYVSVRNSCFKELEKRKVRLKHVDSLGYDELVDESSVLDTIIHAEVIRRVFDAVDKLPERCKKVIRLTFEEGKSSKEISEEMGVTVSTVNNQKMRGLILLREHLSDKDIKLAITILFPAGVWLML